MMISTKLSLQTLALVLVVFTVFTVSLTENLQIADGLGVTGTKLHATLDPGQTDNLSWKIINDSDEKIWVEVFAKGEGSEFMIFEKVAALEPRQVLETEIFVSIPKEHPTDIEYQPKIFALQRGDPEQGKDGGATATFNVQIRKTVTISIGDNPIYTPPKVDIKSEAPPEIIIPEKEAAKAKSLEDKLAEIAASNAALETQQEMQVDDTFEETFEEEAVTDYVPEPKSDPEPVAEIQAVDDMNGEEEEGGGCLIATAAFGSELAPQVQLLREIRDNQLMDTDSGISFMSGFNQLYYSFSPTIADMERESPAFKELVKITITPMISTLSIMEYADSEDKVLGLGIGVILMNLGMYVGLPTFGIVKLIQFRKN